MADSDDGEKSEQPTDKRMGDAKNKGTVARSQEINSWAMLFGLTMVLLYILPWTMSQIAVLNKKFIEFTMVGVRKFIALESQLITRKNPGGSCGNIPITNS